LLTGR
jgi:hypothetical protein